MLPSALKIFVKQIEEKIWNSVPNEKSTITNFAKIKEKFSVFSSLNACDVYNKYVCNISYLIPINLALVS